MRTITALSIALVLLLVSVGARQTPTPPPFAPGVVRIPQAGVVAPTPTHKVHPKYTPAAEAAKLQGTVTVECVVKVDGTVGDLRVVKSLDTTYGLDDRAVKAAKTWRFTPAKKGTKSIRSVVTLDFDFVIGQ
ncbi:MAG TPA: energy transducer TonB [Vicinamibacterales bacterium]|jgi:protein TonB